MHESVGARERLPLVASEQRVDPRRRVGRWIRHLDLHRPAGVEAAAHQSDLLQHSHEHAGIGLVAKLLRRHFRTAAEPRVDRAEVVDRRDVRAREPAQLLRIRPAREQERVGGTAVAPGAPDHLHVALERLGVVVERYEPDVGLVDPHPECGRGDHRLDPAFDERFLGRGSLGRLEPRVVVDGRQVVGTQRAREALAAATGACVDDRRRAAQLVEPADERSQPRLLAVDDLDVVAEVRPDDARADDLRLAAQGVCDLPLRRRRRGRRHPQDRRPAERVERATDEEVVGAEVVPPHADAVHLVDHDETDVDLRDRVEEAPGAEPLGGDVEHPVTAFGHSAQPRRSLVGVERGVDQRRLCRDLGWQLVDLVLHQRDQRAQHERRSRAQHGGELVRERFARAGRHQRERVASLDGGADDGLLAGPEVVESEHARQREP